MKRPNLAADPFLDVRPVWVAASGLALLALILTLASLANYVHVRGRERAATEALLRAQAKQGELVRRVDALNRQLAAVPWTNLRLETASVQEVVARRRLVWSLLLADLERVVPWNIRLVDIRPAVDKDGKIQLQMNGLATDREAWLKLLAVLFADRSFSDPLPNSEEAPSAGNMRGYRFALTVKYWPEGRT